MTALYHIVTVLVAAVFVHLVSLLALPGLAGRDAFHRLGGVAEANAFRRLPPFRPGDTAIQPFADPAAVGAACRYDVREEPVRLRVRSGDLPMSIVIIGRGGRITYALTDRAASRGLIDVRLVTAAQLLQIEAADVEDQPIQELRVRVSEPVGLIVVRAITPSPGRRGEAEALVGAAQCRSEPLE
jgi:uncharacterized membrane protein